jgi:type I restriction enzyme S subunit
MLPAFLYHFLRSPSFHGQVNSLRSGVAQPQLPIRDMRRIKLPLPSLPVQQRIAAVLSAYDGLIENNQRRIQILESMARAIYRQRFVGAANSTFGALCELVKEPFDESEHSDRPLLDLARMPQRTIAPAETGKASELTTSRILFEPGDTLFGAIRCYLHKVLAAHFPGVTNTSVLVLRPKKPSFRSLVALIASDSDTIRWADTHSTGAKMPVINWGVFQTMPAPLPSESAAQEFENVARPMLEQIGILANQIQNLRRTRDLLLPRLLSGQVNLAEN